MLIRYFGTDGLANRIREHCRMARELASWVEAAADWELLAPVPFSTVCFRYTPASLAGVAFVLVVTVGVWWFAHRSGLKSFFMLN